jgi:FkbM family methyltransferase
MRTTNYLRRPDVRQMPVRLLTRRLHAERMRRLDPAGFRRERLFSLSDGSRVRASLADSVGFELYVHGAYGWPLLEQLRRLVVAGDTVVDVGAHIGSFAVPAARVVGGQGLVLAFEPDAQNRERLQTNLDLNGFGERVSVHATAVSDRQQVLPLGSPSLTNSGMARLGLGTQLVECVRLDEVVNSEGYTSLTLMKIDVEGHEHQVLAGAREVIDRFKPAIMTEVNGPDVVELLTNGMGYRLYSLSLGGAPTPWTGPRGVRGEPENVLATP